MKLNPLVTEDSISIWWEKPEAMEGEYRCYIDGKETGRTERTHFTYTGLAPDTAYTMEIRAEGIAGINRFQLLFFWQKKGSERYGQTQSAAK